LTFCLAFYGDFSSVYGVCDDLLVVFTSSTSAAAFFAFFAGNFSVISSPTFCFSVLTVDFLVDFLGEGEALSSLLAEDFFFFSAISWALSSSAVR